MPSLARRYLELGLYHYKILTNMCDYIYSKRMLPDRFIPARHPASHSAQFPQWNSEALPSQQPLKTYESLLSKQIFGEPMLDESFTGSSPSQSMCSVKQLLAKREMVESKSTRRAIHLSPDKVLDAPDIKDDYYLNLLDWSSRGTLSIGLGERVYLYSPTSIRQLCEKEDDYICSLSFNPSGEQLSVGLSSGKLQIYDVERETLVRTLKGHSNRVSSSVFTYGMLFTGSKDTKILGHDYRAQSPAMRFLGHRGEVCGLKHDSCGLASGSNDNSACIWDLASGKMRYQLQGHKAAVKALAWCPWQRNLLATGGGTSDQTMRFWNIETGKLINTVNTNSQVCSLVWSEKEKEILSSHGFSDNQLSLWKYPTCEKIADLHGHSQRVLHMVLSPDDSTVCTASADETIRFWRVFEGTSSFDEEQGSHPCSLNSKFCSLR